MNKTALKHHFSSYVNNKHNKAKCIRKLRLAVF